MEKKKYNRLIKRTFIGKIVYQRLQWEYNIRDCSMEDIDNLQAAFFKMLVEYDFEKELFKFEPISYLSFKNMVNTFIDYMKQFNMVDQDVNIDDIDMDYVEHLVDSLLYGERVFLYCVYFASDRCIMEIKDPDMKAIRNPFYTLGYTTMLDLALIYANTSDPKYLPGIGPQRYRKFQEYFALDCKEIEAYEKK